jgi:hypothetical protein
MARNKPANLNGSAEYRRSVLVDMLLGQRPVIIARHVFIQHLLKDTGSLVQIRDGLCLSKEHNAHIGGIRFSGYWIRNGAIFLANRKTHLGIFVHDPIASSVSGSVKIKLAIHPHIIKRHNIRGISVNQPKIADSCPLQKSINLLLILTFSHLITNGIYFKQLLSPYNLPLSASIVCKA